MVDKFPIDFTSFTMSKSKTKSKSSTPSSKNTKDLGEQYMKEQMKLVQNVAPPTNYYKPIKNWDAVLTDEEIAAMKLVVTASTGKKAEKFIKLVDKDDEEVAFQTPALMCSQQNLRGIGYFEDAKYEKASFFVKLRIGIQQEFKDTNMLKTQEKFMVQMVKLESRILELLWSNPELLAQRKDSAMATASAMMSSRDGVTEAELDRAGFINFTSQASLGIHRVENELEPGKKVLEINANKPAFYFAEKKKGSGNDDDEDDDDDAPSTKGKKKKKSVRKTDQELISIIKDFEIKGGKLNQLYFKVGKKPTFPHYNNGAFYPYPLKSQCILGVSLRVRVYSIKGTTAKFGYRFSFGNPISVIHQGLLIEREETQYEYDYVGEDPETSEPTQKKQRQQLDSNDFAALGITPNIPF